MEGVILCTVIFKANSQQDIAVVDISFQIERKMAEKEETKGEIFQMHAKKQVSNLATKNSKQPAPLTLHVLYLTQ